MLSISARKRRGRATIAQRSTHAQAPQTWRSPQTKASPERRVADAEEGDGTARPSAQGPALTPDLSSYIERLASLRQRLRRLSRKRRRGLRGSRGVLTRGRLLTATPVTEPTSLGGGEVAARRWGRGSASASGGKEDVR